MHASVGGAYGQMPVTSGTVVSAWSEHTSGSTHPMGSSWADYPTPTSLSASLGRAFPLQDPGGMDDDEPATRSGEDSPEPATGGKRPKACLYNCTWRGCRGQRPGKKHNVERHVWLLHLRRPMGRQNESYNAVTHRPLVSPYTRAVGPAKSTASRKASAHDGDKHDPAEHPADMSPRGVRSEPSPQRQREWVEAEHHNEWAGESTRQPSPHTGSASLGPGQRMATRRTHSNPNHMFERADSTYSLPSARGTAPGARSPSRGDSAQPWADGPSQGQRGDGPWLRSEGAHERVGCGTEFAHERQRAVREHDSRHIREYRDFRGSREAPADYLDVPHRPMPGREGLAALPGGYVAEYDYGSRSDGMGGGMWDRPTSGPVHTAYRAYAGSQYTARGQHRSADDLIGRVPPSAHRMHVASDRDPLSAPTSRHSEAYGDWPGSRQPGHTAPRDTHHGLSSMSTPDNWEHTLPPRTHYGPQPGGWTATHHRLQGASNQHHTASRAEPGPWVDTHDGWWGRRAEPVPRSEWAGVGVESGYREYPYHHEDQPMREY